MRSWLLITHNLHAFQVVRVKLAALEVEFYSPTKTEIIKRKDCNSSRKSEKQLFPGYLFLRFDPEVVHTTTISDLPGVKGFVRFGGEICHVSDSVIDALRQSLLLRADKKVSKLECRHVPPETLIALSAIADMRSELDRQAALFALLKNDAQLLKLGSLPYSRISSITDNAC